MDTYDTGHRDPPENEPTGLACEHCDDGTDAEWYDGDLYCAACWEAELAHGGGSDYADRMEERRQMGLCNF